MLQRDLLLVALIVGAHILMRDRVVLLCFEAIWGSILGRHCYVEAGQVYQHADVLFVLLLRIRQFVGAGRPVVIALVLRDPIHLHGLLFGFAAPQALHL
jgi:hypothetical protein